MTNMIDVLFFANQDTSFFDCKKGSDYNKKRSEIQTILDSLDDKGLEHEVALLRKHLNDLDLITSHAYFSIGFLWGTRMMLAVTDNNHNLFFMPE